MCIMDTTDVNTVNIDHLKMQIYTANIITPTGIQNYNNVCNCNM